jgi:hypothetical protein
MTIDSTAAKIGRSIKKRLIMKGTRHDRKSPPATGGTSISGNLR